MKYIKDYKDNGTFGIRCKSQEEWIKICDLLEIAEDAAMRTSYLQHGIYDCIGIYKYKQTGWGEVASFKNILEASDFLEPQYEIY